MKRPPRTYRVANIEDVTETVFETPAGATRCNFNDLTVLLESVRPSCLKVKPVSKKKCVKYFELETVEQSVLFKFMKSKNAVGLEILNKLTFDGLSLNKKTVLNIFRKLFQQLKSMPIEKKNKMLAEIKPDIAITLALRLKCVDHFEERLAVLSFKRLFKEEYDDIYKCVQVVHEAVQNIYESQSLKQLLQIIVQAINQRLKDFALFENEDFTEYERKGVPIHDILVFMSQNNKAMGIIAEKVIDGDFKISKLDIVGLEEAMNVSITERILQPARLLRNNFQKLVPYQDLIDLTLYVSDISAQLVVLEDAVNTMVTRLKLASQYLGENDEYLDIQAGSEKFTILTIVKTLLARWHVITSKNANRRKNKQKGATASSIIKKQLQQRRSSIVEDSDSDGWESEID